jgi:AraC family transcriptional regulator of adaptative response / DNA-3-methyladenine glycosylase II
MKREDVFYNAMLARDYRFDGKFFVGVKTTGIYCRPICPAKPKRENVEFFANRLLAEKAGYRPCLRCRPEAAPLSPAWIGKSAIVNRALKMIHNKDTIEFNEDSFAEMFGISARHLRRVFNEEIGKTPRQIAIENRLNLARKLAVETSLPMTDIAFAAGFQSIRRFNDAFKARFERAPSELRRKSDVCSDSLMLSVPYRPPFDFERLLDFYRRHATGRLEEFTDTEYVRRLKTHDGEGVLRVSNAPEQNALSVKIEFPDIRAIYSILARVRRMFDLDSDPLLIANSFDAAPELAKLLKKYPGLRIPSGWDPFETAIATVLGQLVSVEFGRELVSDLIEAYGEPFTSDPSIKAFPSPKVLANSNLSRIRTTGRRKETIREISRQVASGELSLESTQNVEDFRRRLLSIKGVGLWTADYMTLKVLGHADAFPATDLILARALEIHSEETIALTSPWRGYCATLLWCEYAGKLGKKSGKNLRS